MASTYDPIASTTLTLPASSVTFSSLDTIAAGYRDLVLVCDLQGSVGEPFLQADFNFSSATIYHYVSMAAGPNSFSGNDSYARIGLNTASTTSRTNIILSIFDFAQVDKHKSFLSRVALSGSSDVQAIAGRWGSTSAITSVRIKTPFELYAAGSTFSLYGIAA